MLSVMVASKELREYASENSEKEGEERTMCKAITELIEDGREEGRAEGKFEGKTEERIEIAREMLKDKEPLEKIMKYSRLTREEVLSLG